MPTYVKAYIFDWDGTLVNTIDLTFKIYADIFSELGKIKISPNDFKRLFGRNHAPLYNFVGLTAEERNKIDNMWVEAYKKNQAEIALFPFAKEFLQELKNHGKKLGLVSSGKTWRVSQELEFLGVKDFFDSIVTIEQIQNPKPSPEGLLLAAKQIGIQPQECIYFGDMQEDVIAGKNAGMKTVVILHGMHKKYSLLKLKPDFVYKNFKEAREKLFWKA